MGLFGPAKSGWDKDKLPGFEWYDEKYALNMKKNAERIEKKNREWDAQQAKIKAAKAAEKKAKADKKKAEAAKKNAKKKSGWF